MNPPPPTLAPELLAQAAAWIRDAEALIIAAGAGMGVDSGLPDFRGNEGFWNAYPPFRHLGLKFTDLANPAWFHDDPPLAWGFYGHRLNLYRRTQPHAGFALLRKWAAAKSAGAANSSGAPLTGWVRRSVSACKYTRGAGAPP